MLFSTQDWSADKHIKECTQNHTLILPEWEGATIWWHNLLSLRLMDWIFLMTLSKSTTVPLTTVAKWNAFRCPFPSFSRVSNPGSAAREEKWQKKWANCHSGVKICTKTVTHAKLHQTEVKRSLPKTISAPNLTPTHLPPCSWVPSLLQSSLSPLPGARVSSHYHLFSLPNLQIH